MSEPLNILTDEELYHFVKNDDRRAYTELYERFKRPLLVYALKKVKEEEVAEDIVHDLMAKLWVNRHHIDLDGRFVGYIFKALRNKIIDHISRSAYSQRYLDSLDAFADLYTDPADYKLREESFWKNIEQLLDKYGSNAQHIVRLRMQGYNNHEIGEKLNLSEKTIRNQQSAIIKFLKSKFPRMLLSVFVIFWII